MPARRGHGGPDLAVPVASASSSSARDREIRQPRRPKLNPQACNPCRQFKARCDGVRPTCSQCHAKGRDCEYTGAPGQTRHQALQSKLSLLEDVYQILQAGSPADATQLLERIRTSNPNEPPSLQGLGADGTEHENSDSPISNITMPSSVIEAPEPSHSGHGGPPPPVPPHLPSIVVPSISIGELHRGIEGFFDSSGSLFHAFSRAQISQLLELAESHGRGPEQRRAWCCLSATAAVGHFYIDTSNDSWERARPIYQYAKHWFEDLLKHCPLDALKVSMLMAMFNIMNNDMVALKYLECGIMLSAQFGIDRSYRDQPMDRQQWADCRRVWRTFVLFANWLTSTLGQMAAQSILAARSAGLPEVEADPGAALSEIVQTELTKVAVLEGQVLSVHLSGHSVSSTALKSLATDLNQWYSQLPKTLQLKTLAQQELTPEIRINIYYLHLLHMGVIMLHFRCIATHTEQSTGASPHTDERNLDSVRSFVPDAAMAAMHCARIIALLLESQALSKKCWLVVLQAQTACTVLLYFTVQKKLHLGGIATSQDELERARLCLDALTFTAAYDRLEDKIYRPLSEHYAAITGVPHTARPPNLDQNRDIVMLGAQETLPSEQTPQVALEQAFSIPLDSGPKLAEVSRALLEMLRLPVRSIDDAEGPR